MNRRWSDVDEGGNLSLDIVHRVDLDTTFRGPEFRPFEHAQAQVDGGRVKRIDIAFELEDVRAPLSSGLVYHAVGEVLEDPTVPVLVSLGQIASSDLLPHPEAVALAAMGFQRNDQVSQAFAV